MHFPGSGPPFSRGGDSFCYRGGFRGRGRGDFGSSDRFPAAAQNGGFESGPRGGYGFRGRSSFRPPGARGDSFAAGPPGGIRRPFATGFRGAPRGGGEYSSYNRNESQTATPSSGSDARDGGPVRPFQSGYPPRMPGGASSDRRLNPGAPGGSGDAATTASADENLFILLASLDDLAAGSAVTLTTEELHANVSDADSSLLESDVMKTILTQEASKRITLVEKVRASAKRAVDDQHSAHYNEQSWPSVHLKDQWLRSTVEAKFRQYEQSLKTTSQLEHSVAAKAPALDPNKIQIVHSKATHLHELNERLKDENDELEAFLMRGPLFHTQMVARLARESAELLQSPAAAALRTAQTQNALCEQQWQKVAALQNLLKELGGIRAEQERAVDKAVSLTREAGCDRVAVAEVLRQNDPEELVSDAMMARNEQILVDKYDAELQEAVAQAVTSMFGGGEGRTDTRDDVKQEDVDKVVVAEGSSNQQTASENLNQQQTNMPTDAFLQMQHEQQLQQLIQQQQEHQQQQFIYFQQQQQYLNQQQHPFG